MENNDNFPILAFRSMQHNGANKRFPNTKKKVKVSFKCKNEAKNVIFTLFNIQSCYFLEFFY